MVHMQQMFGTDNLVWSWDNICALWPVNSGENTGDDQNGNVLCYSPKAGLDQTDIQICIFKLLLLWVYKFELHADGQGCINIYS